MLINSLKVFSFIILITLSFLVNFTESFDKNGRKKYFGYPDRSILNHELDMKMHRGPNMDLRKKWLRNPVPYLFLEVVKQGAGVLASIETVKDKKAMAINEALTHFKSLTAVGQARKDNSKLKGFKLFRAIG